MPATRRVDEEMTLGEIKGAALGGLAPISASQVTIALKRSGLEQATKNPGARRGQLATMTPGFRTHQQNPAEVRIIHYANDILTQARELGRCEQAILLAGYTCGLIRPGHGRMYLKVTRTS
ncbi:hypothetical protein [Streptomyces griseoaurantiacus]|uniref:hypothetical protein n=1 Tax=Streptomyces griseoaurantiacus TaxID=68213 RepID=UPI00369C0E46